MMNTYREQIMNLCIQTYYNLYGVMPDATTCTASCLMLRNWPR